MNFHTRFMGSIEAVMLGLSAVITVQIVIALL